MSSLSHNDRSEDLGGGKGNFQDSTKDAIANSRVYTPSLHRDTVPRFSANTATPPSSAARHSEIVSEMLSGQDDNARDIEINKEKLRPQNEVPTHYQAHPYNVKSNTLGSKPSHHVQVEELPTTEEPSGSSVGVGSLPGDIHEAGVATLPEEREKDYSPAQGGLHSRTKAEEGLTGSEYGDTLKDHHLVHEHVKGAAEHHVGSKWEMPSTETPSGARQGVGSLPGKRSEQSVCLLPEERLFPADEILDSHLPPRMDEMPSMEHPSGSVVGVGSLPGKHSEQGVAMTPEERLFPADEILGSHLPPRADQLPSTEKISGSVVGVGSLPGKRSEQGVALTPEERLHPADDILMSHLPPRMDEMPSMEHPSGSIVGVGSLPGDRNEVAVCLMPEERLHPANDILMSHLPPRMDQMPSMEHPSGSIVGVGSLPGQRNEKGVAILPDERKEMGLDKPHRRSSYHRKPSHEPAHEKSQGSSREQKSHQGSGHEQKSGSGHDQKRTLHSERDAHRIGTHPSHYNHHRARGKHGGDHKMREIEQKLGLGTNEDENEMSRRAPSEVGSAGGTPQCDSSVGSIQLGEPIDNQSYQDDQTAPPVGSRARSGDPSGSLLGSLVSSDGPLPGETAFSQPCSHGSVPEEKEKEDASISKPVSIARSPSRIPRLQRRPQTQHRASQSKSQRVGSPRPPYSRHVRSFNEQPHDAVNPIPSPETREKERNLERASSAVTIFNADHKQEEVVAEQDATERMALGELMTAEEVLLQELEWERQARAKEMMVKQATEARALEESTRHDMATASGTTSHAGHTLTEGLKEAVQEFEDKTKELYHGAEEALYGIFHHETNRQAHGENSDLGRLRSEGRERFEAEEQARLQTNLRAMSQDEPSSRDLLQSRLLHLGDLPRPSAPPPPQSPVTIFNADRKLATDWHGPSPPKSPITIFNADRRLPTGSQVSSRPKSPVTIFNADRRLPTVSQSRDPSVVEKATNAGRRAFAAMERETSRLEAEQAEDPQVKELEERRARMLEELKAKVSENVSEAIKEFEETAVSLYQSAGLGDRIKDIEGRAANLYHRAENSISSLWTRTGPREVGVRTGASNSAQKPADLHQGAGNAISDLEHRGEAMVGKADETVSGDERVVGERASEVVQGVGNKVTEVEESIGGAVKGAADQASGVARDVGEHISGTMNDTEDRSTGVAKDVGPQTSPSVERRDERASGMIQAAESTVTGLEDAIGAATKSASQLASEVFHSARSTFVGAEEAVFTGAKGLGQKASGLVQAPTDTMSGFLRHRSSGLDSSSNTVSMTNQASTNQTVAQDETENIQKGAPTYIHPHPWSPEAPAKTSMESELPPPANPAVDFQNVEQESDASRGKEAVGIQSIPRKAAEGMNISQASTASSGSEPTGPDFQGMESEFYGAGAREEAAGIHPILSQSHPEHRMLSSSDSLPPPTPNRPSEDEEIKERESIAGIDFVVTPSPQTRVPSNVQPHYYKTGSSGPIYVDQDVLESGAGLAPVIKGVGGVDFTMSTEGGRLPGYPTQEGMAQLICDRIQADFRRQTEQGTIGKMPDVHTPSSRAEPATSSETFRGSPPVLSFNKSKEYSSGMSLTVNDLGPPISNPESIN